MPGRSHERVLIVEDDPILAEIIRATLEYGGFACEIARTAASAFDRLRSGQPDAITIDLGLPDSDGIELVSALHRTTDIPLIVISGRREEADKIAALDAGADDYIEKPFLPGEFVARIRAKVRLYRADQVDEPANLYRVDRATEITLSRMERALLAQLVKHQGSTVSEGALIASLWGPDDRGTSADLRALVLKLRRKLQLQRHPLFILNERGVGYYVSGFGRFPRRARDDVDTAPEIAAPVEQDLEDSKVQPLSLPSKTASPFFRNKGDGNSRERARQ